MKYLIKQKYVGRMPYEANGVAILSPFFIVVVVFGPLALSDCCSHWVISFICYLNIYKIEFHIP
jgi:hypothetical protein